jgi:replicative DNA helicase
MEEAGELLPSDFTGPNQVIWAEIAGLHNNGQFDMRAVAEAIRQGREWNRFVSDNGTIDEYLASCYQDRGTAMRTYADHIINASVKRSVRRAAALIAIEAEGERATADDILDYAERQILSLRRSKINAGVSIGDIISVFMPRLEGMRAGTFTPAWVPSIDGVRGVIGFLESSDFMVVGGRPGEGKSSFLRAEHHALAANGRPSAIFNMENDPIEYARYMIALDTGLDSKKLRDPRLLTDAEVRAVRASAERISRLPLQIITMAAPSAAEIARTARRLVAENHVELIGVDYIQLVRNGVERRVDDIAVTTGALRALALQMGVPVAAACQLNRAIETRGQNDSDPVLSDLRDSGSIEQDAVIVAFIRNHWRNPTRAQIMAFPENVVNGEPAPRLKAIPVRFHFAKNRNGEMGVSDIIKWNKANGRFQTLQHGAQV